MTAASPLTAPTGRLRVAVPVGALQNDAGGPAVDDRSNVSIAGMSSPLDRQTAFDKRGLVVSMGFAPVAGGVDIRLSQLSWKRFKLRRVTSA